nr:hypothetical protein [Tanacetum cinerariifolium]
QIVNKTVQRNALGNVGNTGTRGTQSYGQVTDNKGKLVICYNCYGEGHILDAKAKAFLADVECTTPYDQPLVITTTNIFEVSHEDAYDSNVDEGPHAAAAFMANLPSTNGTNGATTSHVNEYQLDSEVQDVPTEVSYVSPGEISMITILDDLRNQLDGYLKRNALGNVGNTGTRGTQSYGQVTDNKGKLVICYNCHGEGHMSRQCKEKKRIKDSQYFKDKMLLMEDKEKGAV